MAVIDESATSVPDTQNNASGEKKEVMEELEETLDTSEDLEENDTEDKEELEALEANEENLEYEEGNIAYLTKESEEVSIDQSLSINSEEQQDVPLEKEDNRIWLISKTHRFQ